MRPSPPTLPCAWARRPKAARDIRHQSAVNQIVEDTGQDASLFLAIFDALRGLVLEVSQHVRVGLKRHSRIGPRAVGSSFRRH